MAWELKIPIGESIGISCTSTWWSDEQKREIILNTISLAFGFTGNLFLLLNFTGRVRYIIALPLSIIFWILSSMIVSGQTTTLAVSFYPRRTRTLKIR